MADPHGSFYARCTAGSGQCAFDTNDPALFQNHLRHECLFLVHNSMISRPVFSQASGCQKKPVAQIADFKSKAGVNIAADVFPSVASVSIDSRIVSTRLPVGNSSVVPSAAHASDPESKKFKTIKVSTHSKIKLSTTEPVAAVAKSLGDFSVSHHSHPINASYGPPDHCRACDFTPVTRAKWLDHLNSREHQKRERICISFFDQGLDCGYVMACIDKGEHPIQLRDRLAGMDSIRGVQASAVLNQPAELAYAEHHYRSGVFAIISEAVGAVLNLPIKVDNSDSTDSDDNGINFPGPISAPDEMDDLYY